MTEDTVRYEKNPDYIYRKVVDECVLVPIHQQVADMDCIYTMNPVGAFIWEKLEGGATQTELEAALLDEFEADPQTVNNDLVEFLQELEEAGAIRKV